MEKLNRIEWIDALKGLAIFYVTLGHLGCNLLLEKHIYSFHMFLFFFLSGSVDKANNYSFKEYLHKKFKKILVPFISWNLSSNFLSIFMGKTPMQALKITFLLDGEICWNSPIWFLLIIFITQIVYFLLKKALKINDFIIITVSLLLWIFLPQRNIFFKLNLVPMSLAFYTMGVVYGRKFLSASMRALTKKQSALCCVVIIALAMLNIYFGVFKNVRIVYTKVVFGNILYTIIAAMSGIFFYILLFKLLGFLGNSKLLAYLGKNSMIIMSSQVYFFTFYDILAGFNIHLIRNTLKALIMCVATIVMICVISKTLKYLGEKNNFINKVSCWFGV